MADETQKQSVEVSGWGKRFGFTGPNAFPWFVILLLIGGVAWLVHFSLGGWGPPVDLSRTLAEQNAQTVKALFDHSNAMRVDHKAFEDAVMENTYTLAACLKPRPGVECPNIMMPDSLRKKLKRD